MIAQVGSSVPLSRRALVCLPLMLAMPSRLAAAGIEREPVASLARDEGLAPPLALGMARVVLWPGALSSASTPHGARMIVVEAGVLAVATFPTGNAPLTSSDLSLADPVWAPDEELLAPAGTTVTFSALSVACVRNPGARPVVVLDVAVYREEPRPRLRAFTTEDGLSFQLLASASADAVPAGPVAVALERVRIGARGALPDDLRRGLTLIYIEAGGLDLRHVAGTVYAARAAASAPYALPGALQPLGEGRVRGVTAGSTVFMAVGGEAEAVNAAERPADLLALTIRESA